MVIKSSFGTSHISLLTTPADAAHAASRNEATAVVQLARLNRTLELSSALDNGRARLCVAVYDGKHRESKAFLYMDADNREHEVVERTSPTAVHACRAVPSLVGCLPLRVCVCFAGAQAASDKSHS